MAPKRIPAASSGSHRRPDCARPYSASVFNISGNELWRAQPHAVRALMPARRRAASPMNRRGRVSPYTARTRRYHLGGRIRLFRLPQPGRQLQSRIICESRFPMDQIKWSNSRSARAPSPDMAACCRRPRSRRDFADPGCADGRRLHLAGPSRRFSTPLEMMAFIGEMRRPVGGKPAGFSFGIGHKWEFLAICQGDAANRDLSRLSSGSTA